MTANELAHHKFVTNTQTPPMTRGGSRQPLEELSTNDIQRRHCKNKPQTKAKSDRSANDILGPDDEQDEIVRSANDERIVALRVKAARLKAAKSNAAEPDKERSEREGGNDGIDPAPKLSFEDDINYDEKPWESGNFYGSNCD